MDEPSVFGRGLRLEAGDLVFENGDLATVAGPDNLLQGLRVMIETPFGTDVFHTGYGFDLLGTVGAGRSVRMTKELVRLNLVRSVSADSRVRAVTEVVFDDDPRYAELQPPTDPADRRAGRRWRAAVVLEAVRAGELVVRLDGPGRSA